MQEALYLGKWLKTFEKFGKTAVQAAMSR